MKKLLTLIAVCALTLMYQGVSAQCTVNRANAVNGFTPTNVPCFTVGTSSNQTVQIHVPGTFGPATIDSVAFLGLTGLPTGISASLSPIMYETIAIPGDSNVAVCFTGNTSASVGSYPLTFNVIIYTNLAPPQTTTLSAAGYGDTLNVCAAAGPCNPDSIFNLNSSDQLGIFGNPYASGYLAGNNGSGDVEKAEEFSGPIGSSVTGALLGFGYVNITQTSDSSLPVVINVYDATGQGGTPGTTLTSSSVTLGQIAAAVTSQSLLYVSFSGAPALTAHNFFVSVVLPTSGDTIVLLANQPSADGNGWELWSPQYGSQWVPYSNSYELTPLKIGNYIGAITCGGLPLAAYQSSLTLDCSGSLPDTVYFYNTSSNGATSINWAFDGGTPATSTDNNPVVVYSAPGAHAVQLVAVGSSANDTSNTYVAIPLATTVAISTTQASTASSTDGSVTAIGSGGSTQGFFVNWFDNSGNSIGNTATVTSLGVGTYYVQLTDSATGCITADSAIVTFNNGIITIGGNTVKIYPTPANTVLNIDWNQAASASISITDMAGKELIALTTANTTANSVNIESLAAGTYILHITDMKSKASQSVHFVKY